MGVCRGSMGTGKVRGRMTIAWVFPGQGSQVLGMGREVYGAVPAAREVFECADGVLDVSITRLCFEGPEDELTATENAQPALLTTSVALLRSLESLAGGVLVRPQVVAGHSLGEYSALVAGGSLELETAVRLVRRRGELMAAADQGMMAAIIGLDEATVTQVCCEVAEDVGEPVVVANYNAPGQLVISGSRQAVETACARAKERKAKRVLPLKVSAAFHSPLMQEAAAGMAQALADAAVADLQTPLVANVTAQPIEQAAQVRHELVEQVVSPVQWIASVQQMVQQGVDTFVEIGAGAVLTGLIKRIAPDARVVNLRTLDDIRSYLAESSC